MGTVSAGTESEWGELEDYIHLVEEVISYDVVVVFVDASCLPSASNRERLQSRCQCDSDHAFG